MWGCYCWGALIRNAFLDMVPWGSLLHQETGTPYKYLIGKHACDACGMRLDFGLPFRPKSVAEQVSEARP